MKKRIKFFLWILITIFIFSIIMVIYLDKKVSPIIMEYSIIKTKNVVSIIINRSINSDLLESSGIEDIYIINHHDKGDIISFNSVIINELTDKISDVCEDNLRLIEDKRHDLLKRKFNLSDDYFMVPSGLVFGKSILANFGYDIPINMRILGNLASSVNTDVKDYGLNNSLITISISITVEMIILLPFNSKVITFTNDVPISIKLIQGSIPQIYSFYK